MAVMEEDHDSKHLYMGSVQMANLMVSTGMPQQAWSLILGQKTNSTAPSYSIIHLPKANMVVFSCPFKGAHVNQDLSSSSPAAVFETIRHKNHPLGFLIGKNNPTISISILILSIFNYLLQSTNLKDELVALLCNDSRQLILVGQSLGGSVAALFTIWGLKARDASSPLPLSITFGAPLIGDSSLHVAMKKVPQWTSRFWNILAHDDVVPYVFLAKRHHQAAPLVPRLEEDFRSFGLYLLCSEFGFACVDDPELVLKVMDVWRTDLSIQHVLNAKDYGATLELVLQRVMLYQSKSLSPDYDSGLGADIRQMLDGIGMDNEFSVKNAREIERKAQDEDHRMPSIIDQVKKLHNFKKYRLMLEWYKKDSENRGKDYYDSFKSRSTTKDMDPIKYKNILDRYWIDVVEEAENRPQSDRVPLRTLFLYGGNHYQRVVEPLHIALHYRKGDSRNYMAEGVRPHHFVMLEKWLKEYSLVKGQNGESRRTIVIDTEDSCFWAHVEEARKNLKLLKAGGIEEEESREKLKAFEAYMIKLVRNKSVSSAVFFERGTFMSWWRDYQQILEPCYESDFTRYMDNREYVQYK